MRSAPITSLLAIFGILLASCALTLAQDPGLGMKEQPEKVAVYTDRNFYLAGESIAFALQVFMPGNLPPSELSRYASLELVDGQGRALARQKLALGEGRAAGRLTIPVNAGSAIYYLRAYTAWQRNRGPQAYSYLPLLIIHPRLPYASAGDTTDLSSTLRAQDPDQEMPVIRGLQERYAPGDSLRLNLELPGKSGAMEIHSLSLVSQGLSHPECSVFGLDHQAVLSPSPEAFNEDAYMREEKGLILQGKVENLPEDTSIKHPMILLSPVDSSTRLFMSRSDEQGHFHFNMAAKGGTLDHVIQLYQSPPGAVLHLHTPFSLDSLPLSRIPALPEDGLEDAFADLYLRQRLTEAYQDQESKWQRGARVRRQEAGTFPFYGTPDHLILMDEYIRLPLMEEVFRELGKRVFLQGNGQAYDVRLLDLHSNRIIGNRPWFFMDGVPFFDSKLLLELPPSSIHSIALKSEKYFLGPLIMDGIIDVRSRKGDASILELPASMLRSYFPAVEAACDRDLSHSKLAGTSVFIPWLEQAMGSEGLLILPAPVLEGDYEIVLQGRASDGAALHWRYPLRIELKP